MFFMRKIKEAFEEDHLNTEAEALQMGINALRQPQWIPFKLRPLTEEEREEHPEWDCILDCKLPDDGQEILVTYDINGRRGVWYDEFCSDDGSYLDSGKEIGEEVIAWMPLPEPWRGEEHE